MLVVRGECKHIEHPTQKGVCDTEVRPRIATGKILNKNMKKNNSIKTANQKIEGEENEFALALERHWESLRVVINTAPESYKTADDGMVGLQMVHQNAQLIGRKLAAITQVLTAADECSDGLKLATATYLLHCYAASLPTELEQLLKAVRNFIPQGLFPCGPQFLGQRISVHDDEGDAQINNLTKSDEDERQSSEEP